MPGLVSNVSLQKHERQAQQHYQQLQRRKREEEERQRQAEHMARRERERDDCKGESSGGEHHHDKSHSSKSRPGAGSGGAGGGGGSGSDKPKRPSSLLANNNVMKLKQIIPLQSKFSSGGARSPQSPTGSEPKLPGFLSFKFLKSPENKKDAAAAAAASTAATSSSSSTGTASSSSSSSGSSSQERSQSPSKAFNPGKLFNFGKSEGGTCVNGAHLPKHGEASSASSQQMPDRQPSRSDLNGVPEEIPSPGGNGPENGHSSDLDPAGPRV